MIRVAANEIRPEMFLARSVPDPRDLGRVLLKRGDKIANRLLPLLKRLGIGSLWMEEADTEALDSLVSEEMLYLRRRLAMAFHEAFGRLRADPQASIDCLACREEVVKFGSLLPKPSLSAGLIEDVRGEATVLAAHAADVCQAALAIDSALSGNSRPPAEIAAVGLGALFHDIGKALLPEETLAREPWELSQSELRELESHAEKGWTMLRTDLGAAANMALGHHLFADGSGFPDNLDGERMAALHASRFAALAATANAFVAGHDNGYADIEILEEINCARRHHFAPSLLAALNRSLPPFPLGSAVILSSGHRAVVVAQNETCPFRPQVRLLADPSGKSLPSSQRSLLTLADHPEIRISRIAGRSIEHLLPSDTAADWEETP